MGFLYLILAAFWLLPVPIAFISYKTYEQLDPEGRPIPVDNIASEYDFIIIGGGSAGNITQHKLFP